MKKTNIASLKAHLSDYIGIVQRGGSVLISKRNEPVAILQPILNAEQRKRRPIGLCRGEFVVPDDFNEPLPDDLIALWRGETAA